MRIILVYRQTEYNRKMKKEVQQLSKGCIKDLVQSSSLTGCILQVCNVESNKKTLTLSDGVWTICALTGDIGSTKNYDIVLLTMYSTEKVKATTFIFITEFKVIFTGLTSLIGSPVEWPLENPKEPFISPTIPPSAASASPPNPEEVTVLKQVKAMMELEGAEIKEIPIRALGLLISNWKIKAMLIKKGLPTEFIKKNASKGILMPLEFIDKDKTMISATLFGKGVENYKDVLKVGQCYYISGGHVKMANKKFTKVVNDFALSLDEDSSIVLAPCDKSISYPEIRFVPIQEILKGNVEINETVNVIGIVHDPCEVKVIQLKEGISGKRRLISIFDESCKKAIPVALWKELAELEYHKNQIVAFKGLCVRKFSELTLISTNDSLFIPNPAEPRVKALETLQRPFSHIKPQSKYKCSERNNLSGVHNRKAP
eukprot:TRINITY_DN120116_c0_g1_i1.p1 TRINITY_DN120116_c0_g1~~TRINITY_DN120116_c0_g1_i1.p1  ORF type:complete len:429 (+),score=39.96 TRINITY_DN120116_c0_g1_i1:2698-3984(+)